MPKKWHHGHSLGAGVLAGLVLAQHAYLLLFLGFAGGLAVAGVAIGVGWLVQLARHWRRSWQR